MLAILEGFYLHWLRKTNNAQAKSTLFHPKIPLNKFKLNHKISFLRSSKLKIKI